MSEPLNFNDLEIGHRWQSAARTITQADVTSFAGLTGDFDPLHMDHEFAQQSPFGKPVAHGLLGLSVVAGLGSTAPQVHTTAFLGIRDWQFLKPIYFGDTVHVLNEVVEKELAGRRRGRVSWKRQLINQKGEVVQEGIFETLVELSSTVPKSHLPAKKAAVESSSAN